MKRAGFSRRGKLLVVAVALSLLGAVVWAAEMLTVVEREAAIRRDKRTYSPKIKTVPEGKEVTLIARESPWLRVEFEGVQGWLNESSVTDDPDVALSTDADVKGVRATEQSAAKRGFSPEVEKKHRDNHRELDAAFALLDTFEKAAYPEDEVLKFMEAGQIVPPEGGKP